ncbi:hypothetical protein Tco_0964265, partial [Tanacetum coccineum]
WEGEYVIMGDFNEDRSEHERFGSLFNVQVSGGYLAEHYNSRFECMLKFKKKLQVLKSAIKQWSRDAKSNSFKAKITIQTKLADLDKILDQGGSNEDILNTQSTLLKELHDINSVESSEKAQKAKIRWAIKGDENSK